MDDETNKDELESETQADGGETVENKTTENPDGKDWQKIAEDRKIRAEKAEAEAKELRAKLGQPEPQETKSINTETQYLTRDEGVLLARGFSDEAIAQAKKIAKGADVPLLEAISDPLMTAFLEKEAEEKRQAAAKLGASNGSGATPPKEVPVDDEGHKQLWKEKMGQK